MVRNLNTHRRYLKEQRLYNKNTCQGSSRTQRVTGVERRIWKELVIHQDISNAGHYFQIGKLTMPHPEMEGSV